MERLKLKIIGIEEGIPAQRPQNMVNKIIEEFLNLKKEMPINVQEADRKLNRLY